MATQAATLPAGTIYYYGLNSNNVTPVSSMKADGTQKTLLSIKKQGDPSRLTHGAKRWFLQKQPIAGHTNFMGSLQYEVFAAREDGAASVQLTSDPSMLLNLSWTPVETGSDAVIAGLGRRCNSNGTVDPASVGIYVATVRFDGNGNVIGLDAPPAFLVSVGVIRGSIPDAYYFSFSPDMSMVVADRYYTTNGLRIVDVATGAQMQLISGSANMPAWSPSGSKIAFRVPGNGAGDTVDVVSVNGTARVNLYKARRDSLYVPSWSPDSAFVAFIYEIQDGFFTKDVYRVPAAGGAAINLTADISASAALMGWR